MGNKAGDLSGYSFVIPSILVFTTVHSEHLFTTLVYYNSICHQKYDGSSSDVNCENLENVPRIEDEIQAQTSIWATGNFVATVVPTLFSVLLLSSWSDRVGRKFNMLLGTVGVILRIFLLSFFARFPQISLWYLLGLSVIAGVCGQVNLFAAGVFAYISDTTPDSNSRTIKMTVCIVCGSLGGIAIGAQTAVLAPFLQLYWLCALSGIYAVLGFVSIVFLIEQVPPAQTSFYGVQETKSNIVTRALATFGEALECLLRQRPGYTRFLLVASVFMTLVLFFADAPVFQLLNLYSYRRPLEWRQEMSSQYKLAWSVCTLAGKLFTVVVLTKIFEVRDSILTLISFTSVILFMLDVSISTTSFMMFMSAVVGSFMTVGFATIKAFASKLVSNDEVGKIFAFISFAEASAPLLANIFANSLYAATVDTWPGLTFLVLALFMSVCWLVMIIVIIFERMNGQEGGHSLKSSNNPESDVIENDDILDE